MSAAINEQRSVRILIVEDEAGDARLMQVALQRSGYAIDFSTVSDGHEALRFMRREGEAFLRAPRPDLLLLDLKMPGQSGLEFLATMKQDARLCAIPVVVVTTSALDGDVSASYRGGVAGYISKPNDMNEFVAAIDTLCRYWCKLVRLPENTE
jgi:CheY-like chemotaxis protein